MFPNYLAVVAVAKNEWRNTTMFIVAILLLLIAALLAFGGAAVGNFFLSGLGWLFGILIVAISWTFIQSHWSEIWPWLTIFGAITIAAMGILVIRAAILWFRREEETRRENISLAALRDRSPPPPN
jgi:hypothetical protein